jgi:hypothetical protein
LAATQPLGDVCAVVAHRDGGHTLIVNGAVPVIIANGGERAVATASGLRSERLHGAAVEVRVGTAVVDTSLSLDGGVIAADGFVWRVAASAAPPPPPHAPSMVSLDEPDVELPPPAPLPIHANTPATALGTPAPAAVVPAGPAAVRVQGLRCSRDHFNDPRVRFCAICGIAMHQTSFVLTEDERPPLGVLVFGEGTYHTLTRTLVVGREPSDDDDVRQGLADGVVLADPGNSISRVHAEIRAADWDVHLVGGQQPVAAPRCPSAGRSRPRHEHCLRQAHRRLRVGQPPEGLTAAACRCQRL